MRSIFLEAKYNRICYFTNWGAHRSMKDARLYPEDVPPDLCTHILYAFANLNGLSLQPQIANDINVYQGEKVRTEEEEEEARLESCLV